MRKNCNFRVSPKFEIAAKWARNDQIKRFKKEKLAFFKVFYLIYIFILFWPTIQKICYFTISNCGIQYLVRIFEN